MLVQTICFNILQSDSIAIGPYWFDAHPASSELTTDLPTRTRTRTVDSYTFTSKIICTTKKTIGCRFLLIFTPVLISWACSTKYPVSLHLHISKHELWKPHSPRVVINHRPQHFHTARSQTKITQVPGPISQRHVGVWFGMCGVTTKYRAVGHQNCSGARRLNTG